MIQISLIIISDKNNRILLQHRDGNAPTNPNKWGLWGGRIEKDETPIQAAIRELKEELDVDVSENQLRFVNVHRSRYFNDDWEGYIFHLKDIGNFKYNLQEGDGLQFYSSDEIKNIDIDSITPSILGYYFKK